MVHVDCAAYASALLDEIRAKHHEKGLAIITVGDNPASASYVKGKIKDCEYCGIECQHFKVGADELCKTAKTALNIKLLNGAENIAGIIVQLPLPEGMDEKLFTSLVASEKDVDGFKPDSPFAPCTPEGIMYLLKHELGDLTGMSALVIGRGKLVGAPLAKMLIDANCTVTVAHSKTRDEDLKKLVTTNDIIVTAVGKPKFLDLNKCDALMVVDAGVNRDENGKLCGDCYNFHDTGSGMRVTPVPGGVGLMTRAMLMKHVSDANG